MKVENNNVVKNQMVLDEISHAANAVLDTLMVTRPDLVDSPSSGAELKSVKTLTETVIGDRLRYWFGD